MKAQVDTTLILKHHKSVDHYMCLNHHNVLLNINFEYGRVICY